MLLNGRDRDKPPPTYLQNTTVPVLITTEPVPLYYAWFLPENPFYNEGDDVNPWFWHWCVVDNRWVGCSTRAHTMSSKEPLNMSPSLLWECCGLHGFVEHGKWRNV